MGLCRYRVPIPGGWQSLTLEESPLLTALSGEETVKGFPRPLLGFLHCWETKGIFLFLIISFTICLLPILFTLLSHLLLPFPVTTSISLSASSSICFTFPSLSWDHFCSGKEKKGSGEGSKAGRKGSHWGLWECYSLHLSFSFTKAFTGAAQGRNVLLGVAEAIQGRRC